MRHRSTTRGRSEASASTLATTQDGRSRWLLWRTRLARAAGLLTGGVLVASLALAQVPASSVGAPGGSSARIEAPSLVLVAPATDADLHITIVDGDSLPPNSFVRLNGLSPMMALSDGHAIAPGAWAVPLAAVARLRVVVPAGHSGRNDVNITLVTIDGGVIAEARLALVVAPASVDRPGTQAAREAPPPEPRAPGGGGGSARAAPATIVPTRPPPPPSGAPAGVPPPAASGEAATATKPSPSPVAPRLSPEALARANGFLARGKAHLREGNFSHARLFFQRAADEGLADGALAMGDTFDAAELARAGAIGVRPDPAEARRWYEKARDLGAGDAAARRLERLGQR
jgi:hypothetical protein